MITTSNSSVKRSGLPTQLLGVLLHTIAVPSWPACEPNFLTARNSTASVGVSRPSNASRSCRRLFPHGANRNDSSCSRPASRHNFFLQRRPFVQRHRLQLVHDPRARLHHAMTMPQQLTQITILPTRHPDPRKAIFQQQSQNQLRILAIRLLLAYSLRADLGGIPDPQLELQLGE